MNIRSRTITLVHNHRLCIYMSQLIKSLALISMQFMTQKENNKYETFL